MILFHSPRRRPWRVLAAAAALALCVSASAQVTYKTPAAPLSKAIKVIERQAGCKFFYDDALAKTTVRPADLKNASLTTALNVLLDGTGISYTIDDKIVYLKKNPAPAAKPKTATGPKKTITGKLLDENGEPLIGATIVIKGTNDMAVTDLDGNYSIITQTTGEAPVLAFSYLGYQTKEVAAKQDVVNAALLPDAQSIDEVVVTALGIKREKKMLGYAVQDLKASELNTTGDPNIVGALDGKVAGVQMNTASTGLGGSTKITIRGNSSLTDNNQPLWIVDGVPFTDDQTSSASAFGGYDRGGTNFDINPEDIESISVLKGPNAAALYGARAGNGVILVTTKRGAAGHGIGVSYSGSFTWTEMAGTVKLQDQYGQGSRGEMTFLKDADGNPTTMTGDLAFGPAYDGSMQRAWNGEMTPYAYSGNHLRDYFGTGFAQAHTVALASGGDKGNYRLSVGYNDNTGMFRDEELSKLNIDLSASHTFTSWLTSEAKISVSNTKALNRPCGGLMGEVGQLLLIPGNIRLADLQHYTTDDRLHANWFGPDQHYSNPYYVRHRYQNSDERWRAFGFYGLNATICPWLSLNAKYAFDYYRTRIQESDLGIAEQAITTPDSPWADKLTEDRMTRSELGHFEQNISAVLIGDHRFNDNWRVGFNLGGNIMFMKRETLGVTTQNMLQKDVWILNTGKQLASANEDGFTRAMYSIYGSAQVAWKEYLSLDLTARNDWSSTLPAGNRSFFYPSASVSWVLSDFMRTEFKPLPAWLTFAKLRFSAARVGKDPDPYNLYNTKQFGYVMGVRQPVVQTIKMNADLKPEIKTSYEAGLDLKFLDNRLGLDFTYYYSRTCNQAMLVDTSAPWSQMWVNAGAIVNKGVELMVYGTPVQTRDFTFSLTANLAHNRSTVDELADGVKRIYFAGDSNMPVRVGAVTGGKLGDIYANKMMRRDAEGRIVVNSAGLPQPETGGGNMEQYILDHPIGNIQPDLMLSVTPTLRWKQLSLSALIDMKFGGDVVCVSEGMATAVGTSQRTLLRGEYKEIGGVKDFYMVVPGVKEDGSANDIPVSAQAYYSTIGLYLNEKGYAEEFVHDASYIKLKELSLSYNLPKQWLRRTPLATVRLSAVARNLCFLMKHTPGNPDGGYDTSMFSQALDFLAVPYSRTYGFTVNVEF